VVHLYDDYRKTTEVNSKEFGELLQMIVAARSAR
jgi:hypothetical protein